MIEVTRLSGDPVVVNADLIELVEATPDTVVVLTTGKRLVVRESVEEVVRRVRAYRAATGCGGAGRAGDGTGRTGGGEGR
ncbi:MAG: flagellar FlbD family protein, partial [Clostridia bacterium]|nr:flagellar FlbD family protein [Clostridia bacterium]